MPSVVFDSSVLIPLILPASHSTRLFLRLEIAGWHVVVSPQILRETREKMSTKKSLRQWLKLSDAAIHQFLDVVLPGKTRIVAGLKDAIGAVSADPKDDMIVAAALESEASYIVSEDKHLLALKSYQGITIMNRQQFAAELDRLGVPRLEAP
jgi:putative PIN family toxin of toxin-antitoxin system